MKPYLEMTREELPKFEAVDKVLSEEIAPTFPKLDEMKQAAEVFACCVRLVSVEKLLERN